jgi:thioredoxin reductase (NADPH)
MHFAFAQMTVRCRGPMNVADVVIIGAGPAGLTAATYLGRFHRRAVVIDGGNSRAQWIPESHNIPGFPRGIVGTQLLKQLHAQALEFGADIHCDSVESMIRRDDHFLVQTRGQTFAGHFVLLATGVEDRLPELPGVEAAVLRSLLRICPICDAFEATGRSIAIIGDGPHGAREADFLRGYSDRVTLIHIGADRDTVAEDRLHARGIDLIRAELSSVQIEERAFVIRLPGQAPRKFDFCYAALGCTPQNQLAADLGAEHDNVGTLLVNKHQETSIPRLYAAGDVVRGLNQVVVAAAEAAIAATDIHNKLRSQHTLPG